MENSNRGEGRKGQPHNNTRNGKTNNHAPVGFEGMNYEQKRKPYHGDNSAEKNRNGNPGSETSLGKRRDDL
jgi:hypothetical protein